MSDNTGRSLTPTDAGDTIGLRVDEITSNYYTDPQSTGGMIERGVTNLEKLRQQEEEVKRQTKGDNSEGAIAARKRAADRVSEAKEATEILEVREFTSEHISKSDYTIVGNQVFLHLGGTRTKTHPKTGRKYTVKEGYPESVEKWGDSHFGSLRKSRDLFSLIAGKVFANTGDSQWAHWGSGGHQGTRARVPRMIKQLREDAKLEPKGGMSKTEINALLKKKKDAVDKLAEMKENAEMYKAKIKAIEQYRNLGDALGDTISIQDARKYGIIK